MTMVEASTVICMEKLFAPSCQPDFLQVNFVQCWGSCRNASVTLLASQGDENYGNTEKLETIPNPPPPQKRKKERKICELSSLDALSILYYFLKASRLRRLPVILDFIELPISCSLRLTRGVAGRMGCFGIENHESFHFPFTNFRISESKFVMRIEQK
ncbi:hypothetical protein CUMW_079250 [Citrus unshiu]|uniref:Uncharacterized protein n=1 Tax=Citrus unshiu TaxID=55188 RepID=A0A2H5NV93_CITUN|nr:hypothetical protein CUMW_079250 [Citrus unshiu]